MSLTQANNTIDCADPIAVATFWSKALDRPLGDEPSPYFAMLPSRHPGELTWLFIKVPEARTVKNRMHVDFVSTDRTADIARLLELGASHVGDYAEYGMEWTTLQDVEGNEFCVADQAGHP